MQPSKHTAKLIVSQDGQTPTEVELDERLTIGRSSMNQLVLADQNASRRHAEVRCVGGGRYRVSDVGSANGTWLNGRRLTVPKDLDDGDQIVIGNCLLQFVAPEEPRDTAEFTMHTNLFQTAVAMRNETVVVFVSDIRNYTGMSEALPSKDFSKLIADWFREASEAIEAHGGVIDKFIGDAVMVYWTVRDPANPKTEVNASLAAARRLMELAETFSRRLGAEFPGNTFRIGVGINMGEAIFGNVGTAENQSFTIVGDSVNVAFRLEALCKEKASPVIVSRALVQNADPRFRFLDLGMAEVKGRKEPVSIWSLNLEPDTNS